MDLGPLGFRVFGLWRQYTLPETNMETQKELSKDYSPFKKGAIWVSMLIWGSVGFLLKGL